MPSPLLTGIHSSITPFCQIPLLPMASWPLITGKLFPALSCLPDQLQCNILQDSWFQMIETQPRLLSKKRGDFIDPGVEKSLSKAGSCMTGSRIFHLHLSIHLPSLGFTFLWVDFILREAVSLQHTPVPSSFWLTSNQLSSPLQQECFSANQFYWLDLDDRSIPEPVTMAKRMESCAHLLG